MGITFSTVHQSSLEWREQQQRHISHSQNMCRDEPLTDKQELIGL